jgi:hypothetical protein
MLLGERVLLWSSVFHHMFETRYLAVISSSFADIALLQAVQTELTKMSSCAPTREKKKQSPSEVRESKAEAEGKHTQQQALRTYLEHVDADSDTDEDGTGWTLPEAATEDEEADEEGAAEVHKARFPERYAGGKLHGLWHAQTTDICAQFDAQFHDTLSNIKWLLALGNKKTREVFEESHVLEKSISGVLAPHLAKTCTSTTATLVKQLTEILSGIEQESMDVDPTKVSLLSDGKALGDADQETRGQVLVQQALFIGQLCLRLSTGTPSLVQIITLNNKSNDTKGGGENVSLNYVQRAFLETAKRCFRVWIRFLCEKIAQKLTFDLAQFLQTWHDQHDSLVAAWTAETAASAAGGMDLPNQTSTYVHSLLFEATCQLHLVVGHSAADQPVVEWLLTEFVQMVLSSLETETASMDEVSESSVLQILFDLYFLFRILGVPQTDRARLEALVDRLEGLVDPINLASVKTTLKHRTGVLAKRYAVMFGVFTQCNPLARPLGLKPLQEAELVPATASTRIDANILALAPKVARIPLLSASLYPVKVSEEEKSAAQAEGKQRLAAARSKVVAIKKSQQEAKTGGLLSGLSYFMGN